jgi:hypothetical protein
MPFGTDIYSEGKGENQMNEKQFTYKELMKIVEELKEKTIDWKTRTFPEPNLNEEVLDFLENEIARNNYLKPNKYGKNVITSGWYEKHTKIEIQAKRDYFQDKLTKLLQSESYKATQGLAQFLEHGQSDNAYVILMIKDITDRTYFKASMSKVRYLSFRQEIQEGERPHIAVISVLQELNDRNKALQLADTEY